MKNKNTTTALELITSTKDHLENLAIRSGLIRKKVEIIVKGSQGVHSLPICYLKDLEHSLINAIDLRDLDHPVIIDRNDRIPQLETTNESPYTREQLIYFAMTAPNTLTTIREVRGWAQGQGIDLSYRQTRAIAKIREDLTLRRDFLLDVYFYFT